MGAGQSAAAHVVLDKSAFAPGELVTGAVVFNTTTPVPYHVVLLKFVGKERTHWEVKRHNKGGTSTSTYSGKARIIKAQMPLLTGPGTLGVGGHRLPFALQLPQGLPPTVLVKQGEAKGWSSYRIKVFIDQAGMFAADFKAVTALDLLPRPPRAPAPLRATGEDSVVCCCGICCGGCCCKKGNVVVSVEAPADTFEAGQTIPIKAKVDNRTSDALQCSVTLTRTLRLKSMGLLGDSSWQGQTLVTKQPLHPAGEPVVGGGQSSAAAMQQQPGAVPPGATGNFQAMLQLSPDLPPSVLMQQWYELKVTAASEGCCDTDAALSAPLLIALSPAALAQRATAQSAGRPKAPAGWAPVDYDVAAFIITRDGIVYRVRPDQLKGTAAAAVGPVAGVIGAQGDAATMPKSWGSAAEGSPAAGSATGLIPAGFTPPQQPQQQSYPGIALPPAPAAAAAPPQPAYPAIGATAGGDQTPDSAAVAGGMQIPGPHLLPQQAPGW